MDSFFWHRPKMGKNARFSDWMWVGKGKEIESWLLNSFRPMVVLVAFTIF
jgi:hypothetical protein